MIRGRSFDLVQGKDKLIQDLSLRIMEQIGTDPSFPELGSHFDTGEYIGQVYTVELEDAAREEVQGIIQQYQREQLEKIKAETIIFDGQNTLAPDEVIHTIDKIESVTVGTTILLRVSLSTLSGQSVRIDVPVES